MHGEQQLSPSRLRVSKAHDSSQVAISAADHNQDDQMPELLTPALQMPPFDHQPRPYTGPSRDEVLAARRKHANPAIFTLLSRAVDDRRGEDAVPLRRDRAPLPGSVRRHRDGLLRALPSEGGRQGPGAGGDAPAHHHHLSPPEHAGAGGEARLEDAAGARRHLFRQQRQRGERSRDHHGAALHRAHRRRRGAQRVPRRVAVLDGPDVALHLEAADAPGALRPSRPVPRALPQPRRRHAGRDRRRERGGHRRADPLLHAREDRRLHRRADPGRRRRHHGGAELLPRGLPDRPGARRPLHRRRGADRLRPHRRALLGLPEFRRGARHRHDGQGIRQRHPARGRHHPPGDRRGADPAAPLQHLRRQSRQHGRGARGDGSDRGGRASGEREGRRPAPAPRPRASRRRASAGRRRPRPRPHARRRAGDRPRQPHPRLVGDARRCWRKPARWGCCSGRAAWRATCSESSRRCVYPPPTWTLRWTCWIVRCGRSGRGGAAGQRGSGAAGQRQYFIPSASEGPCRPELELGQQGPSLRSG